MTLRILRSRSLEPQSGLTLDRTTGAANVSGSRAPSVVAVRMEVGDLVVAARVVVRMEAGDLVAARVVVRMEVGDLVVAARVVVRMEAEDLVVAARVVVRMEVGELVVAARVVVRMEAGELVVAAPGVVRMEVGELAAARAVVRMEAEDLVAARVALIQACVAAPAVDRRIQDVNPDSLRGTSRARRFWCWRSVLAAVAPVVAPPRGPATAEHPTPPMLSAPVGERACSLRWQVAARREHPSRKIWIPGLRFLWHSAGVPAQGATKRRESAWASRVRSQADLAASSQAWAVWRRMLDFRVVQNEELANLRTETPFRPYLAAGDFANRADERSCPPEPARPSQFDLAAVRGRSVPVRRLGDCPGLLPVEWALNTTRLLWAVTAVALVRSMDRSMD